MDFCSESAQRQVPDEKGNSNKTPLTLTLSRPTGEGITEAAARLCQSGWRSRSADYVSPSPIGWERGGVRVEPVLPRTGDLKPAAAKWTEDAGNRGTFQGCSRRHPCR